MYGGRRRPANPMIARIRATLNPSFGDHFKITWASIAVSTSWTQARLYFGESDREPFQSEPGPTADSTEPAGSCGRRKMGKVPQAGSAWDPGLEFLYSVLGQHRFHASSVIWNSRRLGNRRKLGIQWKPTVCLPGSPAFIGRPWRSRKQQDMKLPPIRSSLSTRS